MMRVDAHTIIATRIRPGISSSISGGLDLYEVGLLLCGELAAGGEDVAAAGRADVSVDAKRFEHLFESLYTLRGRRAVI